MSWDQFQSSADPAGKSKEPRPAEVERLERVLAFTREMGLGLRREFAPLWKFAGTGPIGPAGPARTAPLTRPGAPAAAASRLSLPSAGQRGATAPIGGVDPANRPEGAVPESVATFVARVDGLMALVKKGDAIVAAAATMPASAAVMYVLGFDREAVVTAARGLESQARALRANPRVMAMMGPQRPNQAGTAPLGQRPAQPSAGTQQLLGAFKRLVAPVTAVGLQPEKPPPPPTEAQRKLAHAEKCREAIVTTVEMVTQVLGGLGPRLRAVATSLTLLGPLNARRTWPEIEAMAPAAIAEDDVPPNMHRICLACAKVLLMNPHAVPRAHGAVEQWRQTSALYDEARTLLAAVHGPLAPRSVPMVEDYPIAKLRGTVLPLTHLGLTFKGVPVFEKLFEVPPSARA